MNELQNLTTEQLKEKYRTYDWSNGVLEAGYIAGELDTRGIDIVEEVENGKIVVRFIEKKRSA